MTDLKKRRAAVWALCGLAVFWAVWTSGIRDRDWVTVTVSGDGSATVVTAGNQELVLPGVAGPETVRFQAQVRGWTASASCANPIADTGAPDYIYASYKGGVNEMTIGNRRVEMFTENGKLVLREVERSAP